MKGVRPAFLRRLVVALCLRAAAVLCVALATRAHRAFSRSHESTCTSNADFCANARCVMNWREAATGASFCQRKTSDDQVMIEQDCGGFNSVSVFGQDMGDLYYYDAHSGELTGTRSYDLDGSSVCRGRVPPRDAPCASKRIACKRDE